MRSDLSGVDALSLVRKTKGERKPTSSIDLISTTRLIRQNGGDTRRDSVMALTSERVARLSRALLGRLLGAIGIGWDATDREKRFTELCASEELFRGFSISCPAGIYRANLDGSVTYVNSRSASIWDMPEEELLGFGWLSRIHPGDRDELVNGWVHANSIGRDYDQEYR